ncbi:chitobiase/beta-hexosaminidase C-terminal domain-containing protein [Acidicapsa dinghuensis]|uniref:Chitobiase/beta-hexosaminidase C-terminal domain-containing protein n=1 Tax=Acidicapsa dinghuensis TaxID=2218256 RepID=A0ABW1EBR5_9BACT|nr:chitobiase/beta-hexosaminidase C-terminal domain-containing protein [Acidicapsa dinghuensis]
MPRFSPLLPAACILFSSSLVNAVAQTSKSTQTAALANYGKLPLSFEPNQGQADSSVQFLSRGQGYSLLLRPDRAVIAFTGADSKSREKTAIRIALDDANPHAAVSSEDQQITRTNYFLGSDPSRWHTNIPNFGRIHYHSVYNGIDLLYYGNQHRLEHDFVIAPHADPTQIVLTITGVDHLTVDSATGDLLLAAAPGQPALRLLKPFTYQPPLHSSGPRIPIPSSYHLLAENKVAFTIGHYKPALPLIIDPVLVYSTYLGGSGVAGHGGDQGNGIAVDSAGDAYIVGTTYSTDFPVTSNAFQQQNNSATGDSTVFISELNPTGTALIYSTYLGGSGGDFGYGIALDSTGNAYITGATYSADFPATCGAYQTTNPSTTAGAPTAFVAAIQPGGGNLIYSTYLGGSGNQNATPLGDVAQAIAVNATGNAYITGYTWSSNFPVSSHAFQAAFAGTSATSNAFVTELNPTGNALVYSTYLGGNGANQAGDYGNAIALDTSGDVFIAGSSGSTNFPVTSGALQTTLKGPSNAFVTELNPAGSAEVYSTYLGGSGVPTTFYDNGVPNDPAGTGGLGDSAQAIAIDSQGNAYVAGITNSGNFPLTIGVVEGASSGLGAYIGLVPYGGPYTIEVAAFPPGAFLSKLKPDGSALIYSTYLEGQSTSIKGLAVDSAGAAYITGSTPTFMAGIFGGFQSTSDALPLPASTGNSAFLVKLDPAATVFNYATLLGGSSNDAAYALALDTAGNVYLTGSANSADFPTTSGAFQTENNAVAPASGNAFVSKFSLQSEASQTAYPTQTFSNIPVNLSVVADNSYWYNDGTCDELVIDIVVGVETGIDGPPPTGDVLFYGPWLDEYDYPMTGSWGPASQVTLQGVDEPPGGGYPAVSVEYVGDSVYQAASLSYTANQPACTSNMPDAKSNARMAAPQIHFQRQTVQGKTPVLQDGIWDASRLNPSSAKPAAPGPKFTPAPASRPESGQNRLNPQPHNIQPADTCLVPRQTATPAFSVAAGAYTSVQAVTITDSVANATIYYTADGTTPTASSTLYAGAITVSTTETINAIAIAAGYENSAVASATYTIITPQPPLGNVNIGASNTTAITLTILNAGTLGSISVVTQGATNLDFTNAGAGTCTVGTAYVANATCTVNVAFSPKFSGIRYGAVVLSGNSGNVLATSYLQGTGSGPQANFLPGTEIAIGSTWTGVGGLFVDESGNVYITSNGQNYKETPAANGYVQSTFVINGRSGGLVMDGAGNFYISENTNVIYKETPSGSGYIETTIGSGLSKQNAPVVDGSGNVFISDALNGQVLKETLLAGGYTQSVVLTCGTIGIQSCPSSVAVDGNGNLFISAYDNSQIIELTPSASGYVQSNLIGSGLVWPSTVAVDGNGNLYIADTLNNRIVKETLSAGNYTQSVVSSSSLNGPWVATVDSSGNVYIYDTGNNRILKEDLSDPPALTFATTNYGVTSSDSPQTVTVSNNGNQLLNFSALTFPTDFPEANGATGACTANSSVAAEGTCTLPIDFTPSAMLSSGNTSVVLDENVTLTTNTLNKTATQQAIAVTGTETFSQTATPAFSIPPGIYTSAQSVVITDATAGATIYYTINGATPTASSMVYMGPITISATETLQAIAVTPDYSNSTVASATYTINLPQAATPSFSPPAGTYTSTQTVTITDAIPGAAIYYTTDGSMPTTASTLYSSALTVSATETINAIATASGYVNSSVASATYTITPPPTFSVSTSTNSLTIAPGQSGTVTISITPQNGFSGVTSFSCSGLPVGVTCSFMPATVTPSGSAAITTTLTISASSTASLPQSGERPGSRIPESTGPILAIAFLLFGRRRRRFFGKFLLITAIASTFALISACGGSSSTPPPVTANISVVATSGTVQQTMPLTITIQ